MKSKSFVGKSFVITLLLVGFGWAVYSIASPIQQRANVQEQAGGFSYAQLTIQGDQVTWDIGGNDLPRQRNLNAVYRELNGEGRATTINLLNAIGANGWELVQVGDNVWTFKSRN